MTLSVTGHRISRFGMDSATAAKKRKLEEEEAPESTPLNEGDGEALPVEADPEVASDGESEGGQSEGYEEESPLEELFAAIWNAADEGRKVSGIFQLLPSRALYPDYYQYIKEPIDLKIIGTKIQSNAYQSTSDLEKDLSLMIRNAKYYNEPGSQVYKDANLLRRILIAKKSELDMKKKDSTLSVASTKSRRKRRGSGHQKFSAAAAALQYDQEDGDPNIPAGNVSLASGDDTMMEDVNEDEGDDADDDASDPLWQIFDAVKSYTDANGNSNVNPFMRLPSKRYYPDYYVEIKNPISLSKIQSKIRAGNYKDPSTLVEDLNIMFENAKKYNRPDSKIYEDACNMQKAMQKRAKDLINYTPLDAPPVHVEEEEVEDEEEEDAADESAISIPPIEVKMETSQMSIKDDTENEESNDAPVTVPIGLSTPVNISSVSIGDGSSTFSVTIKKKIAKRLVTGYIIFASEVRKSVVQAHPDCNFGDISRIIGAEWKNLSEDVKKEYEKKAQKQNEITAAEAAKEAQDRPQSPSQLKQVIQNAVYECHWEHKCDFQCEDTNDLFDHLTADPTGHVWKSYEAHKDKEEPIFQCLFHGCGRVKKGAAPFPNIQRLIRHIKEVHVTKQQPKSIPPGKRGRNFLPSKNNPQPHVIIQDLPDLHDDGSNSHPPASPRPPPEHVFECHWEGKCDFTFEDANDLLDHLTIEPNGHVWRSYDRDKDKELPIFQCLFQGCGRVKKGAT